jgi:hypothetical protein
MRELYALLKMQVIIKNTCKNYVHSEYVNLIDWIR